MGGRAKQCLFENTLVLMADGTYKEIKDVNTGDLVITHLNKVKPVLDNFKTKHTKYLKFTVNGKEIKMSLNHKMLISRDGKLMYCTAKDILKTDKFVKLIEQN